ncbi:MAG: GyrI-like domain-containing protein [Spirochaetaceae bacterium]|nr:GyrI-like domain-containing protein [Spirochaetaceae bacterium]
MAFDFKKEYKEFYLPPKKPQIVNVPKMQFVAVRGKGNPNEEGGEYKAAVAVVYAVSYTLKMSKMGDHRIQGYFDYVVPPLEGFWWQMKDGAVVSGFDYSDKSTFNWISVIRLPDFVTQKDFDWAKETAAAKKGIDCSRAELYTLEEGECVQIMHTGSYDDEPATVKLMDDFALENGYTLDFSDTRLHHEIYLSDPRKTAPEKLKTVIRHPVKRAGA